MENQNQNSPQTTIGVQTTSSVATPQEPAFNPSGELSLEPAELRTPAAEAVAKKPSLAMRLVRRADVILAMLLVLGSIGLFWSVSRAPKEELSVGSAAGRFDTTQIPLQDFSVGEGIDFSNQNVTINGSLQTNGSFILTPSLQPSDASRGEIYYDQTSNVLAYFNGEEFVTVAGSDGVVQSIGGLSGEVALGPGLTAADGQISVAPSGVQSLQGQTGNLILSGGAGIGIEGLTITNGGVLSLQGQTGAVTLTAGRGIAISGTTITNAGVNSIIAGTNITTSADAEGNVTINSTTGGGTVTSSGGANVGTIPMFTGTQNIESSIITQSGVTVTVNGDLAVVTGGLSLSNALEVSSGGIGTDSLAVNGVLVGNGTAAVTSVVAGAPNLCLLSTGGAPAWGACPGGGGVTSLNGLTGALNIANATSGGSTVTIDDASTTTKGIAQFDDDNFNVSGGVVNTEQDINTAATPTFAGVNTNSITPGGALTVGATGQTALLQGSTVTVTSNSGGDIVLTSADQVRLAGFNCTTSANGGALTTDASGNIVCADDDGGGSAPTFQSVYNNSNPASFTLNSTNGGLLIQDAATPIGGNLFAVQSNGGTDYLAVTAAGVSITGDGALTGDLAVNGGDISSTGALTLSGGAGNIAINSAGTIELQDNANVTGNLGVSGTFTATGLATLNGGLTIQAGDTFSFNSDSFTDLTGNGLQVSAGSLNVAVQANKGLEADANGVSLIDCVAGEILKYNGSGQWVCDTDAGGSGVGDDVLVNGAGVDGANFINTAASGTETSVTWSLNTTAAPDEISISVGNASATTAGSVSTGAQTFAGAKTFNGQITTGAGVSLGTQTLQGTTAVIDFTNFDVAANGNTTVGGTINISGAATLQSTLAVQGATVAVGTASVAGSLILNDGTGFTGTIQTDTPLTDDRTYNLPDESGTLCLDTGNCAGAGGGITGTGTNNTVAKFTSSGTIGDSSITDDGVTVSIGAALNVSGNADVSGTLTAGTANAFQVSAAGAVTAVGVNAGTGLIQGTGGLTIGGPVTFSDLTGGFLEVDGSGVVSVGTINLGADTAGDYVANLGTLTGLSTSGNSGEGSTPALSVLYGSTASTAVQGNTTIVCSAGTGNLSGGGNTITLGAGGTCGSLNTIANPTFATSVTTPIVQNAGLTLASTGANDLTLRTNGSTRLTVESGGDLTATGSMALQGGSLTVGADSQAGVLSLYDGGTGASAFTGTLQVATLGADKTYILPDFTGVSATLCLTTGNCAGAGGGITGSGTTNQLAKFTGSGTIGDSSITDNGTTVTTSADLVVQGGNLTVGTAAQSASFVLNDGDGETITFGMPDVGVSYDLTLPTAVGAANQCLKAQNGTGTLFWDDCEGGAGGTSGIASINSQTGPAITVAGTTNQVNVGTAGNTITLSTPQDIHSAATPTFGGLTLNGALSMGANDIAGSSFSVAGATGNVTSGLVNGQTISSSANFTGTVSVATSLTTPLLQSSGAMAITPGGALTVGATGQTLTLQGNASTTLSAVADGFSTTVGFAGTATDDVTYNFDRTESAGTYEICTTAQNCVGLGGSVATPGGTANRLAMFTGGQTIDDSWLLQNGSTLELDNTRNLSLLGGNLTVTGAASATGNITSDTQLRVLENGATPTFYGILDVGDLSADQTFTFLQGGTVITSGNVGSFATTGVTAGAGLTGGGTTGALTLDIGAGNGITVNANDIAVVYGSAANTAVQGNTQITVTAGTNLTGGGSITLGAGGSVTVNVADNPTFAGDITVQGGGLTVGADSVQGQLTLYDGGIGASAFTGTLQTSTLGSDRTYVLPDLGAASDTVCMQSLGNCFGTGGGVSSPGGTANRLAVFTGGQSIDDSWLLQNSSTLELDNTRNLSLLGGNLTVTGNGDFSGTLAAGTGDAFQVSSGGTVTAVGVNAGAGSLQGTGGLSVSGGATLTGSVNANTSGTANTAIGNATGSLSLTAGNFSLTSGGLNVTTAGALSGITTLSASGNITTSSDVAVNGGDITSTGALNITPSGTLTAGSSGQTLTLQGSDATSLVVTDSGFTTTIGFSGTPTANVAYNFDQTAAEGTYDICTTAGNCLDVVDNITGTGTPGTIAVFIGSQEVGDSLLSQSGGAVTVAGNLNLTSGNQFQINGTQISSAALSNDSNLAKLNATQTFTGATNTFRNGADSSSAFAVQNALGRNIVNVDTSGGQLELGTNNLVDGLLVFNSVSSTNTVTLVADTLTGNRTLTLPDADGIICTDSGNCAGAGATLQTAYNFSTGGTTPKIKVNSSLGGVDIQDADTTIGANLFNIRASNGAGLGPVMFGVGNTGAVTLQNSSNSTAAFSLLTQAGTNVLVGDTQNGRVVLGQGGTLAGQLVLSNATNTNTVTINSAVAGGNRTITFPDATGTICLNTGNCLGGGTGGANTALSNLVSVAINTTLLPGAAGSIDLGSGALPFGDIYFAGTSATPGTNNFRITGASTGGTRTIILPDAGGTVCLQSSSACGFAPGTAASYVQNQSIASPAQTADFRISGTGRADTEIRTPRINTPTSGALVIGDVNTTAIQFHQATSVIAGNSFTVQGALTSLTGGGTGDALRVSNSTSTGNIAVFRDNSTDVLTIANGGSALFRNETNSATAFQVQNATGADTLFTVDTTARSASGGNLVKIGNSTGTDGNLTMLQLDSATADPTSNLSALNGGLFYNSTTHKVSLIENGQVKIICNTTDLGCGTGTVTLQSAYNNSTDGSAAAVIDLQDTSGSILIRNTAGGLSGDGGRLFAVQNSTGGTNYFSVDATGIFVNGTINTSNSTIIGGTFRSSSPGSGNSATVTLQSGNAASGNSGNVTIDVGTASGTKGSVAIGTTNASAISIGNSSSPVSINSTTSTTVSNSNTNSLPFKVLQNGSGDTGIEFSTTTQDFYTGIDNTDGLFKIASAAAAGGTTVQGNNGSSSGSDSNSGGAQALRVPATVSGDVSSISVYIESVDGTNPLIQVGVYSHSGGTPGTPGSRLASSSTQTAITGWNTIPISGLSVNSGTVYWIALATQGSTSFGISGSGANTSYDLDGYTLPASWGQNASSTDNVLFYISVVVSGASDFFGGTSLLALSDSGALTLQNSADSASAFRVLNASDMPLFSIDTSNNRVNIGNAATSDSTAIKLILDTSTSASDPSGVPGAMYHNSSMSKIRCYEGGAWRNCAGTRLGTTVETTDGTGGTGEVQIASVAASVVAGNTYTITLDTAIEGGAVNDRVVVRLTEDNAAGNDIQVRNVIILTTSGTAGNPAHIVAEYTADATETKTFVATIDTAGATNINRSADPAFPTYFYVDYTR